MNGISASSGPKEWAHVLRKDQRFQDDGFFTFTSIEQKRVEEEVLKCYETALRDAVPNLVTLFHREKHSVYLRHSLVQLCDKYSCLDASRPWLCYWTLHSLELLGEPVPAEVASSVVRFLRTCQDTHGGYGGGPGQAAHLATTYAAVMALCIIGTQEAFDSISRAKIYHFFKNVKQPDGSFLMQVHGEMDIRGAYCAAAVASMISLPLQPLFRLTPEWLSSCQTYEGGFAGDPSAEAHGGYTFCGLAALILLGHERLCDLDSLVRWLAWKQTRVEGGFQGRTNKLVDACYSYWQGAAWCLAQKLLGVEEPRFFDVPALQHYLVLCCQSPEGGLWDKPGKSRDLYHTCYALSGLALCQSGDGGLALQQNHELLNVSMQAERKARDYFGKLGDISVD